MSSTIGSKTRKPNNSPRGAGLSPPPDAAARTLAECVLELLDYVTKHSDDSTELNDAIKWRLEEILR